MLQDRTLEWLIVDGIGPFFRGYRKRRINWSKIPLAELPVEGVAADEFWAGVREDMREFVRRVKEVGYNTVTLDDVAHVAPLAEHGGELRERVERLRVEMKRVIRIIKEAGLRVLMTTDVMPMSREAEKRFGGDRVQMGDYFAELLERFLDDFCEVDGVILRLGEGDGHDVKGRIRNELFVRTAKEANVLMKRLLPIFEERGKVLICRTWTVGAYPIGDLIWHRKRIAEFLKGIESKFFIMSLKYGESDFFRYLPLNEAFFQGSVKKVIEFQARREYEGAGEYPNFVGFDVERYAEELREAENLVGVSVWVQTGGWHAFRRISYVGVGSPWVELNSDIIVRIFRDEVSARDAVGEIVRDEKREEAIRFFELTDEVVRKGLYVEEFAEQKWFFRRVRIPPLIHVYWDCVFFYHPVKKLLSHFVDDGERAIGEARRVMGNFSEMEMLAGRLEWGVEDVRFMRDTFEIFCLAREYYFGEFDEAMRRRLLAAKTEYKRRYPRSVRQRFRVKTDFSRFSVSGRKLAVFRRLFVRNKRGYRLVDQVITLQLLGVAYRFFSNRNKKMLPKFVRKSAMGVDALFK